MTNSAQDRGWSLNLSFRPATAALAIAIVFALATVLTQSAQAQTFTVLHTFSGEAGGDEPQAGVTMDAAGNLYGTTYFGGIFDCPDGCGIVFKLGKKGSGWILTPLYSFPGFSDGAFPYGRVAIAQDGTLYGTTNEAGNSGNGTVFQLKPSASAPKSALAPWTHTVLYNFTG